jgi:hypothetical protein
MSVKDLQVVLNSWLTWREYVNIKVKARKSLQTCRRAFGMMRGSQSDLLALHLHHSTIQHLCISRLVAL